MSIHNIYSINDNTNVDSRTLLVISVIIASISVFITFVGNLVSAQIITTDISWLGDTDSENEETENEETGSSESLTLEGLSPQDESDLAIACSMLPERC
jgi:hypothetical protein